MHDEAVFVRSIVQKDRCTFTIQWTDGIISDYKLHELQKSCTCARCRDEKTGESLKDPLTLKEDVQAYRIFSVGRYALKVDFTSGCSKGIFTFSFLRRMALK